MTARTTTQGDVTELESLGNIDSVNSNSLPLLINRNELNYSRNYFLTQNGIRARLGSTAFKTTDNGDEDINGVFNYMEVFGRDEDEFYYQFFATTTGYLYFCKFSNTTGATVQDAISDLSLGTDYPTDVMSLDLQDDTTIITEIARVKTFQYAILRSPTAVITAGTPNYWALEPAFDVTEGTAIKSATLGNKIFFIDGTGTLYYFDGVLGTGRKLSTVTITKTEFVALTDKIVDIFTFNSKLWIITDTDKVIASAPGDGTLINDALGFYVKIGRIEGMDIQQSVPTKNAVFIGLTNPATAKSQTKMLTGSSTSTYTIEDVDSEAGIIGSSGVCIGQEMISLTQYGFINIQALASGSDRFGLTKQKTISSKVNGDVLGAKDIPYIKGTYYPGASDSIRNWFVCQLNQNFLAIYDVNFSTDTVAKWNFFTYQDGINTIKSFNNRLFAVFADGTISLLDAPTIYKDNGTAYNKEIRTFTFGKTRGNDPKGKELLGIEKQFKDVAITIRGPGTTQTISVTPLVNDRQILTLPNGGAFSTVQLVPVAAVDLDLTNEIIDLSADIALGVFQYETYTKVVSDRSCTGNVMQLQLSTNADLDLEIIDIYTRYALGKFSFDTNSVA